MERVSVIIPTYNRKDRIVQSVKSVLNQTYHNLEIIIVDDGSTDGTEIEINKMRDTRIKYVALNSNQGAANARNIGVGLAESEWVAFQDSDDIWHENKPETQMSYVHMHPEFSLVYCSYMAYLPNGENVKVPDNSKECVLEGKIMNTLLERNTIGAPTICVKKNSFLDIGGYDVTYRCLEDWEFAVRFARKNEIGFIPEALMDVYVLPDGVSMQIGSYYESRCRMLAQYKDEMKKAGLYDQVKYEILNMAQMDGVALLVDKMMSLLNC